MHAVLSVDTPLATADLTLTLTPHRDFHYFAQAYAVDNRIIGLLQMSSNCKDESNFIFRKRTWRR